jgi:hypothetical protein
MGKLKTALLSCRDGISRRPVLFGLVGICLMSFAVHAPLLMGTFIHFDDGLQIFDNWCVTDLTWEHFADALFTNYTGKGSAPSFVLTLLNWAVTPYYAGFAFFNLLWFTGLILIFYRFSALFISEEPWRLISTLLFSLHSLNVDALGWMSSRCHIMGTTFVLCCFIFWQKYQEDISYKKRLLFYVLAVLTAAIAIWNKGIFLVIPGLIVVYDIYRRRRISLFLFLDKVPLFILAYLPTLYTPLLRGLNNLDHPGIGPTVWATFMNDAGLVMEYLYRLVAPGPSAVTIDVYPVKSLFDVSDASSLVFMRMPPIFNFAFLALLFAAALFGLVRYRAKNPFFMFMFILVALSPVMNIPPRWVDFAFRFEQMPLFFFSIAFGAGFAVLWKRFSRPRRIALSAFVAILLVGHIFMSVRQALYWDNELSYWTACGRNFPDSIVCRNKASWLLETSGRMEEALAHDQAVHRIAMYRPPNRSRNTAQSVARTLRKMDRSEEALTYLKTSLLFDRLSPNDRKNVRNEILELEKKLSEKK